uniref:Uncharacterized protein n=1 Tax=Arion vulgaris TaxID=1028688 RepID=A0A0B6Z0Q6_9EUPU
MSLLSGQSWQLDRYARFVCDANKSVKDGKWKYYDDTSGHIVMTLTDVMQLIISQNTVILESHSLVRAQCWMRGLSRNDSLLFMYKFQSETRKFRVRFSKKDDVSGTEICTKVIHQLSRFSL